MSSSNLVRVAFIKETTEGVTPGAGNFSTARFTSESLSGTPSTTQSQQIRTDRMPSGQIVTGLEVTGDLNVELAKEAAIEEFMSSAMNNPWQTMALQTLDLEIDTVNKEIKRTTGSFIADGYIVGDFNKLAGFSEAGNNVIIMITDMPDALTLKYVGPEGMVDEVGPTGLTSIKRADKLTIGQTQIPFTIEKAFLDLTNKAIAYRGMKVSTMELNVAYGELVTSAFTFQGVDHEAVDSAIDFPTNGRTINAPATTDSFNGSIDMPFIASSALGELGDGDLCIQSLGLTLENNLTAKNCIGKAAPEGHSLGNADITISMSTYLKDSAWGFQTRKITQEPFALGFALRNDEGNGYGFYLPAIQVTSEDPSSGGQNQEVSFELEGTARVGLENEGALTIYRF